jgi:phospholipase C
MLIPNFAVASSPHRALAVRFAAPLLCAISITLPCAGVVAQPAGLEKIQHVIVIYQENWSFDGLYGRFPGADGIANAGERIRQMNAVHNASTAARYVEESARPRSPLSARPASRAV